MLHVILAPDLSKSIKFVEISSANIKGVTFLDNFPVFLIYTDAI